MTLNKGDINTATPRLPCSLQIISLFSKA